LLRRAVVLLSVREPARTVVLASLVRSSEHSQRARKLIPVLQALESRSHWVLVVVLLLVDRISHLARGSETRSLRWEQVGREQTRVVVPLEKEVQSRRSAHTQEDRSVSPVLGSSLEVLTMRKVIAEPSCCGMSKYQAWAGCLVTWNWTTELSEPCPVLESSMAHEAVCHRSWVALRRERAQARDWQSPVQSMLLGGHAATEHSGPLVPESKGEPPTAWWPALMNRLEFEARTAPLGQQVLDRPAGDQSVPVPFAFGSTGASVVR